MTVRRQSGVSRTPENERRDSISLQQSQDAQSSEEKTMSLLLTRIAVVALAGVLAMTTTSAQNPPPTAPPPPPLPYGPPIPVETAKRAAAAALAEAKKNNWFMAVAVVDPSGTLVYFEKMDNTQTGSINVSIDKAKTAALYKRPSKVFQDAVASGGAGLRVLGLEGVTPVEGGIPIIVNSQIIGAIGVSGDSSEHDGVCALAGSAVVK
jgi:glc operon protein GlcG